MRKKSGVTIVLIFWAAVVFSLGFAGAGLAAETPVIDAISPTSHASGAFPVILSGNSFTGVNAVFIYDAVTGYVYYFNAPFTVDSDSQITVNANLAVNFPGGTYYFQVFLPAGGSNNSPILTVSGTGVPVIDSISPTGHDAGAFPVILTGQHFTDVYNLTVYSAETGYIFYSNAHFTFDSDTQITVNPDLLINFPGGTYNFVVINFSGTSNHSPTLTVAPVAPVITGIDPTRHSPGTFSVVLTGSHFTGITDLNYTGPTIINPSIHLDSDSQVTIDGTFAVGAYTFQVVTPDGASNDSPTLTVAAANPGINILLLGD